MLGSTLEFILLLICSHVLTVIGLTINSSSTGESSILDWIFLQKFLSLLPNSSKTPFTVYGSNLFKAGHCITIGSRNDHTFLEILFGKVLQVVKLCFVRNAIVEANQLAFKSVEIFTVDDPIDSVIIF